MTCFVKGCKNVRRLLEPDSGITFHQFPTNEEAFSQWLSAIGKQNENVVWKKSLLICSDHFQPDDFVIVGNKRRLKVGTHLTVQCTEKKQETIREAIPSTSKSFKELSLTIPTSPFPVPEGSSKTSPTKKRKLSVSTDETSSEPSPARKKFGSSSEPSGSESSGSRKRRQFKLEHSYSASPGSVQKKAQEIKKKYIKQSRKLYRARESVQKLKRKVTSLSLVLKDLKSKHTLSTFAMEHLEKSFIDIPKALMCRMLKNVGSRSLTTEQYPEELRKFAFTLHFYSCKAYDYVRKTFNLALPHPSTIRKWGSAVECLPGFSTLSFSNILIYFLGAYIYPSRSLVTICYESETFIRRLMHLTDNTLPSPDFVHDIITNVSAKLLPNLGRTIYSNHVHNFHLLKLTINCYCKIRLHNLSKKYSTAFRGDLVRKKFNKLILFHHQ